MARNSPDERVIYLALKDIFRGPDAQLRKSKKVRELIQKHQHCADIRDLIEEHSFDNVYSVTKVLLEQQVFESTLRAKLRFPEVFEVSPAQSAEREASEAEAAKTEADAIRDAAEGRQGVLALEEQTDPELMVKGKERACCRDKSRACFSYMKANGRFSLPGFRSAIPDPLRSVCYHLCSIPLPCLLPLQFSASAPGKGANASRKSLL